jgi:hypothetical protein
VGVGLAAELWQYGSGVVAMLALAVCVGLGGAAVPWGLRRALLIFCLLLAASALVLFAARRVPWPGPSGRGADGCPEYWRGRLRSGQLAEVLRFVASACVFQAIRMLPRSSPRRSWRWWVVVGLLLGPLALVGVSSYLSVDTASSLLPLLGATAPGVLTLVMALGLTALTVTRVGVRPVANGVVVAGVLLMMFPALFAVESLADLYRQLPGPGPSGVPGGCLSFYGVAPSGGVRVSEVIYASVVALPFLSAPGLIVLPVVFGRAGRRPGVG